MTFSKHGRRRAAGTAGRQRAGRATTRTAAAAAAAVVDALEGRRLMSLTISLQTTGGADSAVVTSVGQVVTLDVVATVTAPDGTTANDAVQDVEGSFLSAAVGASAVAGNLSVANVNTFDGAGAVPGVAQDLNGDGNLDVGSNVVGSDAADSPVGDYFLARAGTVQTAADGTLSGDSVSFTIATATYTVTSLSGGGQTNINFRPRDTAGEPTEIAARWGETAPVDGTETETNEHDGTFAAGSPFHVYTSTTQATTGTVTAAAYDDANGNGTQDGGEAALAGAQVYVDLAGTGTYVSTDPSGVTGTAGTVSFDGVPAGTYPVRVVPPSGFTQTEPASTGAYTVTTAAGATTAVSGPFGAEPDGTIAGTVYTDANGDGTQQSTEGAAPANTVVYLDLNNDGVFDAGDVSTTAAAGTGAFEFDDVAPGTYSLRTVVTSGYTLTEPTAGLYRVTVAPAGTVTGQTFGVAPEGSVTGTVFTDANGNGTQDAGEAGLAGVTVYLDLDQSGTVSAGDLTVTTDATGTYTLSDVPAGTYTLRDVVPTGDTQSTPAGGSVTVTVTDGSAVQGGAFGVVPPASATPTPTPTPTPTATGTISGTVTAGSAPAAGATVYLDANGNGVLDTAGTVIGGAYTLTGTTEPTATTAVDGTYSFTGLAAGTYTVREVLPLGETSDEPTGGSYTATVDGTATTGQDFVNTALPASGLTAAFLTAPKATALGGTAAVAKVRVTDAGPTAFAGPVTVALYPSDTTTASAQDVAMGTAAVKSVKLKAGKSATVTVKYTYPTALAAGTYHVVAAATSAAADAPAVTATATTVAVTAAVVDLKPTVVGAVSLKAGRPGSVAVRLTNGGNVTATGTVGLTLTLSAVDPTALDAMAVPIGTLAAHKVKIPAGKSVVVRVPFTAPSDLSGGSHDLVVTLAPSTSPADVDAADKTVTDVVG